MLSLIATTLLVLGAITVDAFPQPLERRQTLAPWAQCGGTGYTGSKTCPSGYHCQVSNEWYSQCTPGAASSSSSKVATTSKPPPVSSTTQKVTTSTKATSTSKTAPSSSSTKPATPTSTSLYRYLGRVNPATNELTWPGSGIAFAFTGTSASVPITKLTGTNSLQIIIDNGTPIIINNVTGTSISTGTLPNGPHTVEIRHKSEALYGTIVIGAPTTSGTLTPVAQPAKRIEIIGDSISVGYGLDGELPCTNSAALEDAPKTYGAVAAGLLDADYSIVAVSGRGVVRNNQDNGDALLPELWTRYGANDADNTYPFAVPVDYVVVNLGTNDFGYLGTRDPLNATVYEKGMVAFGKQILAKYPSAQLFLTSSPMLSDSYPTAEDAQHSTQVAALKQAVAELGAKAHFVDFPAQGSDVGCDYHPNAATQESLGEILAAAIKSVAN